MSKRPAAGDPVVGDPAVGGTAPPEVIYIIRHAEKPVDAAWGHGKHQNAPGGGVDFQGDQNEHCLLPRGWQRSGALAALFAPASGPPRAGLRTPGTLLSPSYGDPASTAAHRSCQTIQGLADRLGLPIATPFEVGHESHLAASVLNACSGVVLICWEHDHIPDIAAALPAVADTVIPRKWPGDRFDVIWAFTLQPGTLQPGTLQPGAASSGYAFSQIPQQLLSGDADGVIAS